MLIIHGIQRMVTLAGGEVRILDDQGLEWVFEMHQALGMRIRDQQFEVEFRGTMMDHRFVRPVADTAPIG